MIDWLDAYLPNILPLLSTGVLQLMIVPVIVILPILLTNVLTTVDLLAPITSSFSLSSRVVYLLIVLIYKWLGLAGSFHGRHVTKLELSDHLENRYTKKYIMLLKRV